MSGLFGGGGSQSQTTTFQLPREARKILSSAQPFLDEFLANPAQFTPANLVPGFNPTQLGSQQNALGAAFGGQTDLANSSAGALNNILDPGFLFPGSNPALQATIDAAVRPLQENFSEVFLPSVRNEFEEAGQFGGSRFENTQLQGQRDLNRQIGDTASTIASNQFNNLVNAQLTGLGRVPSIQGAQTAPAATQAAVGDVQQQQTLAELTQNFSNEQLEQFFPLLLFQNLAGTAAGIPGGSTTSTASQPQTNPLLAGLGGALSGFGASGSPIGALLGGGLGFGSAFL